MKPQAGRKPFKMPTHVNGKKIHYGAKSGQYDSSAKPKAKQDKTKLPYEKAWKAFCESRNAVNDAAFELSIIAPFPERRDDMKKAIAEVRHCLSVCKRAYKKARREIHNFGKGESK